MNVANHSPRAALFFNVLLAIAFSFLGDIEQLINYVAFTMWLQRTFTMSALLYMRIRATPVHPEAIHTPIIIPVIFLCVCLSLVCITIAQNFHTSAVGLSMLLASLVLYLVFLWERALPRLRNFNVWCEAINREPTRGGSGGGVERQKKLLSFRESMRRLPTVLQRHNKARWGEGHIGG